MDDTLYKKSLKTLEYDKVLQMLCDFAQSEGAKDMALSLLPHTDISSAKTAQSETTDALKMMVKKSQPSFSGLFDVREGLGRAQKGAVLTPSELLKTASVLKISADALNFCDAADMETSIDYIFKYIRPNNFLKDRINEAILPDETLDDRASSQLYDIRRKMRLIESNAREILNKLIRSPGNQKYLMEPIITMRGDRFVVPVKIEHRAQIPGLVHDTSASGATIFVEPMSIVEANNQIKVLLGEERAEIERILSELSSIAGEFCEDISQNYVNLVRLDFIFAKAKLSRSMDACAPILSEEQLIDLKKARHPLIDRDKVVSVDISLGGEYKTLVITGPNTGGKTVVLKTIGLFCLMGASGLHIPAKNESRMPVFKGVYADIGDEQSIEQSLSTFSSHMKNIAGILEIVDSDCLVLLDELGAGTDPVEGAALAMSILEHLKMWGALTASTTHYSELKLYALSTPGVQNASCEFDVNTLSPTYRLMMGIPGKSNAFEISSRLGINEHIIANAQDRLNKGALDFEDVLKDIQRLESEAQNKADQSQRLLDRAEQQSQKQAKQVQEMLRQAQKELSEAKERSRAILERARMSSAFVMSELDKIKKKKDDEITKKDLDELRERVRGSLSSAQSELSDNSVKQKRTTIKRKLKVGDSVNILGGEIRATVLSEPDKNGNLTVQAGMMKVSVNISDVSESDEPEKKVNFAGVTVEKIKKNLDVKTEIDVRGQNIEDALLDIDKFLDQSMMAGLSVVSVIHGKGTGALRGAVHAFLRTRKGIKDYHLGRYGEGETGVTIVEFTQN